MIGEGGRPAGRCYSVRDPPPEVPLPLLGGGAAAPAATANLVVSLREARVFDRERRRARKDAHRKQGEKRSEALSLRGHGQRERESDARCARCVRSDGDLEVK